MTVHGQLDAVTCNAVTKDFHSLDLVVRALRGVDLQIRFGELTLLVGPSGCGKTTLINIIAGVLTPTSGQCLTLGIDFAKLSATQRAQARLRSIGFIFQQLNLVPMLSAEENVAVPLLIGGQSRRVALAAAREQLSAVGLSEFARQVPSRLSGGQQQRVAIARALITNPRLIVCDEPTSALDAKTGHRVMEVLKTTALEKDRAVVVVTHDPRVHDFADRVIELDDGVVRAHDQKLTDNSDS